MREREDKPMTAADIRYTTKGSTLYAIALDWPRGDWRMPALGSESPHLAGKKITKVEMVGVPDEIEWYFEPEALVILPPATRASEHAYVFRIEVR
jgi:alpha-L-fucosidase